MKPIEISEQAQRIMENLLSTVELAEEAPDFVASSFQRILDEYADARLEEAAAAIEKSEPGPVAAKIHALKRNDTPVIEELQKQFADRRRRD